MNTSEPVAAPDVASAIIERHPGIDQMQLHKLLYLTQAADLVWFDEPAFPERIEAWKYGPMVRTVAGHYKDFGLTAITAPVSGDSSLLSDRLSWVVDQVLEMYGDMAGPDLAAQCKAPGSPWRQAREGVPDNDNSSNEISSMTIQAWHRLHGLTIIEPTSEEQALAQSFIDGDASALEELFSNSHGRARLVR